MGEQEERAAFDRRHAAEVVEITVLTGTTVGGAGKAGDAALWTPSADVIAFVDERGGVVTDEGRLSWLATDDQRGGWIHDLQAHTQYVVRVRRADPDPAEYARWGQPVPDLSGHFALVEVVERDVHVPALDERLARWLQPVVLSTDLGDFTLERSFGHFVGVVDWPGGRVRVSLDVDVDSDEGGETCTSALARLIAYAADATGTDARWRAYAASTLVDLAEDWRQQADADDRGDEPVTAETFVRRIRLIDLGVAADGSTTPYYADGDLFWGHVILLDVEPDGSMTDAYIAG
ncbi:DUF2262 domain-containing protein [Nocardioides hwasunensis]|uniref:DUF2262 domain-containing protein n=1 Tax=Nocardioides hwasunensis TaxID=397258 RepID=A0ABR8MIF5_9ACTN|nr:DUF2262 domain-containing protein [Nocardioides hwasunensis]MBD3915838.1 DUF2262 domain-containing protein [Nocardioides hwasunensis]